MKDVQGELLQLFTKEAVTRLFPSVKMFLLSNDGIYLQLQDIKYNFDPYSCLYILENAPTDTWLKKTLTAI